MPIKFDINLDIKDMYRFSMYHTYTGIHGIMSIAIAILAFVVAGTTWGDVELTYSILYVCFGFAFLFYMPATLYLRAKRQIFMSEELKNTLHYSIDEAGIKVTQNGAEAQLPWKQVYKITATKNNVLIYSNRINAYIIPKTQLGEQYAALKEVAKAHLETYCYCIRK